VVREGDATRGWRDDIFLADGLDVKEEIPSGDDTAESERFFC
jgi:hypothetical protein